ncbi:hypothetical protein DFH08DRAFT_827305 [Mycena albidolilacea]|uniref:Uncharacterized protein n=1 Tax=Mycena albidolilacea TaxID=1033008 RepID=A0AAD6YZ35_9AGAR|nr:hypothetical protein DFH08DRAFT_827305 [Mycena albidolilacea]
MPADRDKGKSKANNPTGGNQHSSRPLLDQYPDLPQWIQGYIDDGIKQPDMPRELSDDHEITVKLRSIERIIKNQNLRTTRHSGLTDVDKGAAILAVTQEDPLARWGGRKIKEKLSLKTIHVPRMASKFIDNMRGVLDRDAADMRKPGAKKKILLCMGIAVWGIIDKYAREELNLWVVPDARTADGATKVHTPINEFQAVKNKDLPAAEAGSAARSAEDLKATGAEGYLQGLGKDKKMNLLDK